MTHTKDPAGSNNKSKLDQRFLAGYGPTYTEDISLNSGLPLVMSGYLIDVVFCTIMAISRQKEAQSRDYVLLLSRDCSHTI